MTEDKKILVFGATGNSGGATARELQWHGWQVRAVSRNPEGKKAQALQELGMEVVKADMDDRGSLEDAFQGMKRVFSVQNWTISGVEGEIRHGKLVAEAARSAQVEHLVYLSAGTGDRGTGLSHFDSKLEVEAHMRKLDLPFTVIRPGPFMELMTQKDFYPALGIWGVAPKVLGWDTPKPWVAVRDIGKAAANIFSDPQTWLGREITLFGDVKSLGDCRAVFSRISGKKPLRVPLPVGLFNKIAGKELVLMWQWIVDWVNTSGTERLWEMVEVSRELVPGLLDIESWVKLQAAGAIRASAKSGVSPG
jgi:uncharacterized protein YbjT (DUF2867 family)